jgi:hypothetical protein
MRALRAWVVVTLANASLAGCYTDSTYGYGYTAYGEPPAATDVYYEARPGQVWVNGRYAWVNGAWAWRPGYYTGERAGYTYVQGYWGGGRWYDGRWEVNRPGYLHTGGYWEPRGRGYAWREGGWERERAGHVYDRGHGSGRTYVRGGWRR